MSSYNRKSSAPPTATSRYDGAAWIKVVSASVGSTVTALAVTPLEVVKVRQQASGNNQNRSLSSNGNPVTASDSNAIKESVSRVVPRKIKPCPNGCGTFVLSTGLGEYVTPKNKCRYFDPITGSLRQDREITQSRGTLHMLRSIFVKEGLGGIYAGLAPTLVMGIPNTIIYFYCYEELSAKLRQRYPDESAVPAVAGASSRFLASLSTAPFELLRTQQAARIGATAPGDVASLGMVAEFRTMIGKDGISSLFRGVWPTLMRDVPFSAIYWMSIEWMRDFWKRRRQDTNNVATTEVSPWQQAGEALINGSVSGTIAAAMTTPLDVLKTRSQVGTVSNTFISPATAGRVEVPEICDHGGALAYRHPSSSSAAKSVPSYESMAQITKTIIREEGIAGLWRGNVARMMKVAPACAIMISSYEIGKRVLIEHPKM